MLDRRTLLAGMPLLGAAAPGPQTILGAAAPGPQTILGAAAPDRWAALRRAVAEVERAAGGPLGLSVLDTGTGRQFGWRANTRFPMCSTFKLLLAARLLAGGPWRMDDALQVTAADVINPAPFTRPRIGSTATLTELAGAMVTLSDNPAANIALKHTGGPAALTRWLRQIGDGVTRLDRMEPEMNNETPGDPRDTTTPAAMLWTARRVLLGGVLAPAARVQLLGWMANSETGATMLRSALPAGWQEAHKTGAGADRARNIVSLITPPGRKPILVSAYLFAAVSSLEERNRHFPALGRAVVSALG